MRRALLGSLALCMLGSLASALTVPAQRVCRRAALHAAATATLGLAARALPSSASDGPMNGAEQKLQQLLRENVAKKEAALGFKFEPEDVAEVETILRNKYCGKAGLFGSMEGGTCAENVITAAYCSTDDRFSNSAGCPQPKPVPRDDGPPRLPTLDDLPSLPSLPKLPF